MLLDAALPPVPLQAVPGIAKEAERLGFNTLWSSETMHDPFLPIALAAEHTRELKLGTAVAVSFARSPTTMAYTAWDLAQTSGGRFLKAGQRSCIVLTKSAIAGNLLLRGNL